MTRDLDNNTTIELDTLLSTLDDFVSDCDSITCLELRELLAGCKCFFSNFNLANFQTLSSLFPFIFLFSLLLQWNFLADFADFVDLFCIFAL